MSHPVIDRHPVFACLDEVARNRVSRSAIPTKYRQGAWIAHHGSTWSFLFLVEQGLVQAIKESPEGRSLMVAEIGPGEMFWGISFFIPEAPMPVALVAKEETKLLLWAWEDLEPLILKHGCMSWEINRLMIRKMQYASAMLNEFVFQPAAGRLARVLLEHYGDALEEFVARDMTLDEMAARIGSTREMVCRHLYQFADQGAIHINRTEFKITDPDLLKNLAGKGK